MRYALLLKFLGPCFLLCVAPRFPAADQNDAAERLPQEVRGLAGTYTGSWTMYGIDDKGEIVERMAWTDTIKADKPEVKGDRAFVSTVAEMVFEGGKAPPFKMQGREGYFLKREGGLGDYFIESFGQVQRMIKLGDNVWSHAAGASPQELGRLGFPAGVKGQHVLIKVLTKEQGIETHRISRLSTVNWKNKEGKDRWLQFVSLKGYHKRQP